jgi:HKD family nuclease
MKEGSFEYKIFQKIINHEELKFNEIRWIERLLTLSEVNEEILNKQIGLSEKKGGLMNEPQC